MEAINRSFDTIRGANAGGNISSQFGNCMFHGNLMSSVNLSETQL